MLMEQFSKTMSFQNYQLTFQDMASMNLEHISLESIHSNHQLAILYPFFLQSMKNLPLKLAPLINFKLTLLLSVIWSFQLSIVDLVLDILSCMMAYVD